MKKQSDEFRIKAKESAKWLLSQMAVDDNGENVVLYGKPLNNMEVILSGLLRSGSQGAVAPAMNLLTISGMLGDDEGSDSPSEIKKREESSKRYKTQLKTIKNYITKKLKENGTYDNSVTYAIEVAAVNILLYRKLADEILPDHQSLLDIEISREGAKRKKASPLLGELQRQMERTLASLRDLSMTVRTGKPKSEDDTFAKFMEDFKDD